MSMAPHGKSSVGKIGLGAEAEATLWQAAASDSDFMSEMRAVAKAFDDRSESARRLDSVAPRRASPSRPAGA